MDKSHKYFAFQETKTSHPDNMAPEHQQYHQIAIALPPQGNKFTLVRSHILPVHQLMYLLCSHLILE